MNEEIKANINNHIQNAKNEIVINKIRLSEKSSMKIYYHYQKIKIDIRA